MKGLLSLPLRRPWLVLLVMGAATVFFGFFARSLRIDSSIENLMAEDDPDREFVTEVKRIFGDDGVTVIGFFADDVFAPATLGKLQKLSDELAALDGVREVISLTTVKGVELDDFGLRTGRLMRELPGSSEEAAAFRARVLSTPLYSRNVVAQDGRAASVVVVYEPMGDEEFIRRGLADQVQEIADRYHGPEELAVTGTPTMKVMGARLMEQDTLKFTVLSMMLTIAVLTLIFRSPRGVLLPLTTVVVGVVWTAGIMVLAGSAMNMGTLILNPLLMVVGLASGVHIVTQYYLELAPGRSRDAVVQATIDHVSQPVAIAGMTTLIGFGALIFTPIRAVREFGLYSVIGIVVILLTSFAVIPAALILLRLPKKSSVGQNDGALQVMLARVARFSVRHRRGVLVGTAVVLALSVWGILRIQVETNYLAFFGPSTKLRQDTDRVGERLGGTTNIHVVIDGDGPQSITKRETLEAIAALQEFISRQPGVDTTVSLLDYLGLVRRTLQPKVTGDLPPTQEEIDQILLLVDPTSVRAVASGDYARANVLVRTHLHRSSEVAAFVDRIEEFAAARFPSGVRVHPTGNAVMLNRSADALAWGQVTGLWQEVGVLLVLLSLLFLSVRIGALALIPNVIPTVILFGIMGWSGISLNVSTSMIAAIAIGIAIDDTIHLLSGFNHELRTTGDQAEAVVKAVSSVGQAAVFISAALAAGFFIVSLSNFRPVQHFGVLSGVTMGVALITELLLTPALFTTTKIVTLWDMLFVKLGADPHKQIPVFADLRPFQARIVVLMAKLATARKGERIIRLGEQKAELYVILHGAVEAYRAADEHALARFGRGAVIGEMGFVRRRPRTADVVAVEDTDYLILDEAFLARLPRRYPRLAAKLFRNLTCVLSDRLEVTTDRLVQLERETARRSVGM